MRDTSDKPTVGPDHRVGPPDKQPAVGPDPRVGPPPSKKSATVSARMPPERRRAMERISRSKRRDLSSVINEMLEENLRMRRIPGIVFADEPNGRRPWIAGTGLEVKEIIGPYVDMGCSWERLKAAFDWLGDYQLRAALAYYETYRDEVDEALAEDEALTPERVWAEMPFTRPPHESAR